MDGSPRPNIVYRTLKVVVRALLRTLYRIEVEGTEHVPQDGPVVIASNHLSFLDPLVLGVVLPRPIAFIARGDLFKIPGLGWLLRKLYAIPVERGSGDLAAVKAAIRALREGMAFGIFPEGRRSRSGKLEPFKTGAAAIALRTGATVVPVAITGTDEIWPPGGKLRLRGKIRVVIGPPVDLGAYAGRLDKAHLTEATRRIERAVAAMLPREYLPEAYLNEASLQQETPENAG